MALDRLSQVGRLALGAGGERPQHRAAGGDQRALAPVLDLDPLHGGVDRLGLDAEPLEATELGLQRAEVRLVPASDQLGQDRHERIEVPARG